MTLLEVIKPRIGVFYSEENKDNEIQSMINGAIQYFKGAGWDFTALILTLKEKKLVLKGAREMLESLEELEEPTEDDIDSIGIIRNAIKTLEGDIAKLEIDLSLPIEAITLYCKMAQPTSAFQLTNHPVLTSMIAQGRSGNYGNI